MTIPVPKPTEAIAFPQSGLPTPPWYDYLRNVSTSSSSTTTTSSRRVTIIEYGADPTGVDDSLAAIQAAIDFMESEGGGQVIFPYGVFRVSAEVTLKDRVHIVFEDCIVDFDSVASSARLFRGDGTIATTTHSLAANAFATDRHVTLGAGNGASYARGDWVLLRSDDDWATGAGLEGEILRVASVWEDRLQFDTWIRGRQYLTTGTARVHKFTPLRDVQLTGRGHLIGSAAYGSGLLMGASVNQGGAVVDQIAIEIRNAIDVYVEGITITDFHSLGVTGINILNGQFERVTVDTMLATASNGYGLSFQNASQQCKINSCKVRNARHAIAQGVSTLSGGVGLVGITRGLIYEGNMIVGGTGGTANAIDVHPGCDDAIITGNHVSAAVGHGILSRGRSTICTNNRIDGATDRAAIEIFNQSVWAGEATVTGNSITDVRAVGVQLDADDGGTLFGGGIMFPGETIQQLGAVNAVDHIVESHLHFSGNTINVRNVGTNAFATGSTQLRGEESLVSKTPVNTVSTLTAGRGIWVNATQGAYDSCTVTGNTINGNYSPVTFVGILVSSATGATVDGNNILLPNGATGTGIFFDTCSHVIASGNVIRGVGTPSSSNGILFTGSSNVRLGRNAISNVSTASYRGTATFNPSNLADAAGETTTVTVSGAALGDLAHATFSLDLQGITLTAWVSATDTVSVRFQNESGGTVNLASGTLTAIVQRI